MITINIGSLLSSLALFACGGAALLVALAFILFRAITGGRGAAIDTDIWEPQETDRRSPFAIPSTGSNRRRSDSGVQRDPEDRDS